MVITFMLTFLVPEYDIECENFTAISIDSLLSYEKNITYNYI